MTYEEAKEILTIERDSLKETPFVTVDDRLYEAFDKAIEALDDADDYDYMLGNHYKYLDIREKLHNLKEQIDNLETYTIHMGVAQPDKVCVEYKEVKELFNKLEEGI